MSLRTSAKGVVEWGLVTMGATRWGRWRHRNHAVILAYHNVLPEGKGAVGDRSLHLPFEAFRRQINLLSRTHQVVSLAELLDEPSGKGSRPRAAITFDDAYRGAVQVALPWLHSRGLPATVFVAPGLLGDQSFWWDLLADPGVGGVPAQLRAWALTQERGEGPMVLESKPPETQTMPPHARSVTREELLAAGADPLLELAAHSWSHPNLTRLSMAEVKAQVRETEEWFQSHLGRRSRFLAYPYGLFTVALHRWLFDRGILGFGLQGGMIPPGASLKHDEPIARINIPAGVSLRGFELRVSGVLGG